MKNKWLRTNLFLLYISTDDTIGFNTKFVLHIIVCLFVLKIYLYFVCGIWRQNFCDQALISFLCKPTDIFNYSWYPVVVVYLPCRNTFSWWINHVSSNLKWFTSDIEIKHSRLTILHTKVPTSDQTKWNCFFVFFFFKISKFYDQILSK